MSKRCHPIIHSLMLARFKFFFKRLPHLVLLHTYPKVSNVLTHGWLVFFHIAPIVVHIISIHWMLKNLFKFHFEKSQLEKCDFKSFLKDATWGFRS